MSDIKGVAFDLEGTVVNIESLHHEAHRVSAREVGVNLNIEECFRYIPHFIGGPDSAVAEDIAGLAKEQGTDADPEQILRSKKRHYEENIHSMPIKIRQGYIDVLEEIQSKGLPVSIGSLTTRDQAELLIERSGLGHLISPDYIVLREDVENPKPAPDVWIETAKRMDVEPSSQIVFEDSPRGIQGAVEIGAYCVGMPVYNRPEIIQGLLEKGAQRVFMQWDEINASSLLDNINAERNS